jgi:hypothetical protein
MKVTSEDRIEVREPESVSDSGCRQVVRLSKEHDKKEYFILPTFRRNAFLHLQGQSLNDVDHKVISEELSPVARLRR